MNTFDELLKFLTLSWGEKMNFLPAPRTSLIDFDLVSGHLQTTFPLQFLISLSADVFATESYQPLELKKRNYQSFAQLLGLLHLMLWCRDERIWDPRVIGQPGGSGETFAVIWDVLQKQAIAVSIDLNLPLQSPTVGYDNLFKDWAGEV